MYQAGIGRAVFLVTLVSLWRELLARDALHLDTFDIPSRTCEPIAVEMCTGNGYNHTGGPNFLNEEFFNQQDLALQLGTFSPLIKTGCSKQLLPFLCIAYIPMCDPKVEQVIGPCRPVCENVKDRCQPILKKVGLPWPAALNCSIFPEKNTAEHMCMPLPPEDDPTTTTIKQSPHISSTTTRPKVPPCLTKQNPAGYKLVNSTGMCQAQCDVDVIFTNSEKQFSEIWIAVWTSFSLLFSLLTVITFFIDTSQFPYPKRPIIFLSLSYAMYTIGYLVRLTAGRKLVLCDSDNLITEGLDNANCTAVFLLLYYFSTAAAIWWIVFGIAWLLSAGLRWSHEAIELYSSYFHLFAWGVPAIQSIVIIVLREVSGEELTGLCFVGGANNPSSLFGFVIAPLSIYLLVGIALLVAGYIVSFCHDRKQMKKSDDDMEILMVRVGVFSLLYTVPTTCLLACYFYEYLNAKTWGSAQTDSFPSAEIFALKTFASLLPGITSGLCILTCKNFDTWSTVCGRPCLKRYASSTKSIYHCGSSINSNNNNNTRHYAPVKSISVRHSSNAPSQYSNSMNRTRELKHHHLYVSPPRGPSSRYPGEYHV